MAQPNARRYFGGELSFWRRKKGFTQEQLAREINYSPKSIQAIEQGLRAPSADLCRRLDAVLDLDGVLSRAGEQARGERPGFKNYLEHESAAQRVRTFDLRLVHGRRAEGDAGSARPPARPA